MALIKCPECNKEISDTVDNCIHCGYSINKRNVENTTLVNDKQIKVLIEETNKKIKMLKLISIPIFIFGFLILIGATSQPASIVGIFFGLIILMISLGIYAYAAFNTWWEHK